MTGKSKNFERVPYKILIITDSTQVIQEPIEADSLINNDDTTSDKTNRVAPRKSLEMLKEYGNAWKAYFRHPILPAGLGLAFLYMTVLAFDGITIGTCQFFFT